MWLSLGCFLLQVYSPWAASAAVAIPCPACPGRAGGATTVLRGLWWRASPACIAAKSRGPQACTTLLPQFFLPFLVKKQFIKVGLSPAPPDPFTSRLSLLLREPPLSAPVPPQASSAGTDRIHGSSQDLGWLWSLPKGQASFSQPPPLCFSQIGVGTWAGCNSLVKGASFHHLLTAPTGTAAQAYCYTFPSEPEKKLWPWLWRNERTNWPFITVLVYSNFCLFLVPP